LQWISKAVADFEHFCSGKCGQYGYIVTVIELMPLDLFKSIDDHAVINFIKEIRFLSPTVMFVTLILY